MSNYSVNRSFVLRGIEDVVFEERPVPERTSMVELGWWPGPLTCGFCSRTRRCIGRSKENRFEKSHSIQICLMFRIPTGICGSDVVADNFEGRLTRH